MSSERTAKHTDCACHVQDYNRITGHKNSYVKRLPFLDTNIILTVVESVNYNDNSFNTVVRPYVTTKNLIWDRKTLFVLKPLAEDCLGSPSSGQKGDNFQFSTRDHRQTVAACPALRYWHDIFPQSNIRLSPSLNTIPSHLLAFLFILRRLFWTISSLHSAFLICTLIFGF